MDSKPEPAEPLILKVLRYETTPRPPVWFMRQAGRYLPEYRALREKAGDFMSLCFNPQMAAEVTLQPMRRFAFDAAIVFADILLIPEALGQKVWFETGEGPRMGPLPSIESLRAHLDSSEQHLAPIGETLRLVRAQLEPERALIGFAGGPWTVATYMINGRGGQLVAARTYAFQEPEALDALLDVLVEATARYLIMQAGAGAQVLQLFESWAENLPEDVFERIVIGPHRRVIEAVRAAGVTTPFIGFPRGAGTLVENYVDQVPVNAIGLDVQASAALGRKLQAKVAIQGALDPILLRAGGPALDRRVDQLLEQWSDGPYIFNLGHGIILDTPIAHIEQVVARVTGYSKP